MRVYNLYWGPYATRMYPILEHLVLGHLSGKAPVLDLCCGTGSPQTDEACVGLLQHFGRDPAAAPPLRGVKPPSKWPYSGLWGAHRPESRAIHVARDTAEVLAMHTTLKLECIDRMSLNVYVPVLQTGAGAAHFFPKVRRNPVPPSALMDPMTRAFVRSIERFAAREGLDLVPFERIERKDK